jgi:hypothetical protein
MQKCRNRKNAGIVQNCKCKTEEWKMKEISERQCLDEYRKTTGILEARFRVNSVFHSIQPLISLSSYSQAFTSLVTLAAANQCFASIPHDGNEKRALTSCFFPVFFL